MRCRADLSAFIFGVAFLAIAASAQSADSLLVSDDFAGPADRIADEG